MHTDNKKDRFETILAGSGGQGLVLSGMMLAEAAMLEGKNVVQTVSYGIASRGGFSMAEVIMDKEEIIFQQVQNPDAVLVFTQEAMAKFRSPKAHCTAIFYDTTLLEAQKGNNFYGQPFTAMAVEMGHVAMANIIALGYMAQMNRMVETQSLAEIIKGRFEGDPRNANLKALDAGVDLAVSS